ncbi:MAG: VOC family protein [Planctomycetota bacterium]
MATTSMQAQTKTTVKPIPEGYHTITATLICRDAAKAIEFYKKALGATETMKMCCSESGKVMHAELKVGDSVFFVSDEMPQMGCMSHPTSLWLYVNDCDAAYNRAIAAGATVKAPLMDMFWGDRMGQVTDAYGHIWTFATHKLDLTQEQMMAGQKAWAAEMKTKMQGGSSQKSCG